jgi:hypothetical protein
VTLIDYTLLHETPCVLRLEPEGTKHWVIVDLTRQDEHGDDVVMWRGLDILRAAGWARKFADDHPGTTLEEPILVGEPTAAVEAGTASRRPAGRVAAAEPASPTESFSVRVPELRLVKGDAA